MPRSLGYLGTRANAWPDSVSRDGVAAATIGAARPPLLLDPASAATALALAHLPYGAHDPPTEPPLLGPVIPWPLAPRDIELFSASQIAGSLLFLGSARPDLDPLTVAMCGRVFLGVAAVDGRIDCQTAPRGYWRLPDAIVAGPPRPPPG